jgi:hypothetical protein
VFKYPQASPRLDNESDMAEAHGPVDHAAVYLLHLLGVRVFYPLTDTIPYYRGTRPHVATLLGTVWRRNCGEWRLIDQKGGYNVPTNIVTGAT